MSLAWPAYIGRPRHAWRRLSRRLASLLPKGLYPRALLIVILPVVLLQSTIAWVFMERHWQYVTSRLSATIVSDIATVIDLYEAEPTPAGFERLKTIVARRLMLDIEMLSDTSLPPAVPKPFFSILDTALSQELSRQIGRPFWIDTVGRSRLVEIRIQLKTGIMRIITHRNQAYASNSRIFLMWMIGTSLVLLAVAIAFLRNQIRPILRLARAAEEFGKGRDTDFRPHGAREVRQAGQAFIEMKRRVERAIEQRTTMLNGVSHDLRTILTRFRLSLAMLPPGPELEAMNGDIDEMQRMLEAYLAFARGDGGEVAETVSLRDMLEQLATNAERHGRTCEVVLENDPAVTVRPHAFRRLLANLIDNAGKFGTRTRIQAICSGRFLTVHVDDDGPGIAPEHREDVFRPFLRLDEARNQDTAGTGLGLAIARDIARIHGGDIEIADSPLGGVRASVRIPV